MSAVFSVTSEKRDFFSINIIASILRYSPVVRVRIKHASQATDNFFFNNNNNNNKESAALLSATITIDRLSTKNN